MEDNNQDQNMVLKKLKLRSNCVKCRDTYSVNIDCIQRTNGKKMPSTNESTFS